MPHFQVLQFAPRLLLVQLGIAFRAHLPRDAPPVQAHVLSLPVKGLQCRQRLLDISDILGFLANILYARDYENN